jgi:hypothetical protein
MVAPISGFSSVFGIVCSTIPPIAPAALAKMRRDRRFKPETSTTECIIVMSLTPTYGPTLPEAMVDTMSLGMPTGSAFMAVVPMEVPPEPPRLMTPSNLPSAASLTASARAPRPMISSA